jgi:hypothetical protein
MARVKVTSITPDAAKSNYLARLDDDQAVCMSQGHGWPKIKPGKPLPRGINVVPEKNGQFQVRETCPSCGTVRTWTTLPGGQFDMDIQYRYEHPKQWTTQEKGTGVTRRDIKASVWKQFGQGLASAPSATEVRFSDANAS